MTMPEDRQLLSELGATVLLILVFAAALTWLSVRLLQARYRAVVRRLMAAASASRSPGGVPEEAPSPAAPPPALAIQTVWAPQAGAAAMGTAGRDGLMRAYAGAGLAYAVSMGAIFAAVTETVLRSWVACSLMFCLPLVWTLLRIAARGTFTRLSAWIAFWVVAAAAAVVLDSPDGVLSGLLLAMLPPALVLAVVSGRRLGAIGPLVYAAWLSAIVGLFVGAVLWSAVHPVTALPVVALYGLGAWKAKRWLDRLYTSKRLSDEMMPIDACWFVFTAWAGAVLLATLEGSTAAALAVAALALLPFALYFVTLRAVLRRNATRRAGRRPLKLLLLRTFGARRRSERLVGKIARKWRYVGSINLIAGADLASATLEPHELFDFLGGRLARRFVSSDLDARRAAAALDHAPDPNGRYRINELFCRDDTWRVALRSAAAECDAVLLDFRGFSPRNRGCVYELGHLVQHVPLSRVIVIVDETTDMAALEAMARRAWSVMPADSPNRRAENSVLRLFPMPNECPQAVALLVGLLHEAATRSAPAEPAPERSALPATPAVALAG